MLTNHLLFRHVGFLNNQDVFIELNKYKGCGLFELFCFYSFLNKKGIQQP